MPAKVRVTASHGPSGRGPAPPLIYRAETYDDGDPFREPLWKCPHDHDTVEGALHCGEAALDRNFGPLVEPP